MLKYENGKYSEMTPEEIESLKEQCVAESAEPTTEERLAALEAAMLEQIMGVAR